MTPRCCRSASASISVLLAALLVAGAQQAPTPVEHANGGQVVPKRDKNKEEDVAKLFEGIRSEAKLPRLKRIKHRPQLEQAVCTSALVGTRPKGSPDFAFYTTTDPGSATPELKTIASSNRLDRYHGKPIDERYSVAVWKTKASQRGNPDYYWVGVAMYGSAAGEFVDCHFTDDVYYCGKWKESIAFRCRGK